MNQAENIKEKYKKFKLPRKKSSDEILNWIEDRYNAYKISFSEYIKDNNRVTFNFILINLINHLCTYEFSDKILEILIYKIPKNEKTEIYFLGNENYNKVDYFYLVFEKNTQYFSIDQHIIFGEIFLFSGISEYDRKKDSINYLEYLTNIDLFYNNL